MLRAVALALSVAAAVSLAPGPASAQVAVTRTRYALPSSNGRGAIIVRLDDADPGKARRLTHFREHLFAVEEPQLDAAGDEIWNGSDFAAVYTRDLVFDVYFGIRGPAGQRWLIDAPVDLDASGYAPGGTGVVRMVQNHGDLELTQYFFAPQSMSQAGFAIVMEIRNAGATTVSGAEAFSLHNFHLGYGRAESPWDVHVDIGENGETLTRDSGGTEAFLERGFAGTVVARALTGPSHFGTAPGADVFATVQGGGDLPDNAPAGAAVDGAVGAWQWSLPSLAPGGSAWVGVVFAHHGDPFAEAATLGQVDAFVAGRGPQQLVLDELDAWAGFQTSLVLPAGLDAYEEPLVRQSAAMLRMGQVQEDAFYLRQWLAQDGEVRRSRFNAALPGTVNHNGRGAILASLPPGNWTYAWIRDGAYAISAMATLGMATQARDGLSFYLDAEAGRFRSWTELGPYNMPDYQISLVRYYGFGVEETDFNAFGPNLEFDGFGLFLWALRNYERSTGDESLASDNWTAISERVADVIVALVEPETGLLLPDSSIWETHWNGRERHWAYTNITAARGLCDAAEIAQRLGDGARADTYREAGEALRDAIATRLTDGTGAVASNLEELEAGEGYFDAAVVDAIAMGLFDPQGPIATATLAALDEHLLVSASEVGWSRNDDRYDHPGAEDWSPWGSDYDSAEWVITDLRGAVATRLAGDAARSDAILQWITAQAHANYLMVAETFEETTGEYKFNTPMLGFGAGAFTLAVAARAGEEIPPACGAYYDEGEGGTGDGTGSGDGTSGTADGGASTTRADVGDDGVSGGGSTSGVPGEDVAGGGGCGCRSSGGGGFGVGWLGLIGVIGLVRRRALVGVLGVLGLGGCAGAGDGQASEGTSGDDSASLPVSSAPGDSGTSGSGSGSGSDSGTGTGTGGGADVEVCPTVFWLDEGAGNPRVAGEWNDFELATATPLLADGAGGVSANVDLAPGLHAYKVIRDVGGEPQWALDPGRARRKYVDGVENSAVKVRDCNDPTFVVDTSVVARPSAGQGSYNATLRYVDGAAGWGPDAAAFRGRLRSDGVDRALEAAEFQVDDASGDITVALAGLADGKYTVEVVGVTGHGRESEPTRLVVWVEAEAFDWRDALVYMVVTDRFANGDSGNDPMPVAGADPRGDWFGGDLWGLRDAIEAGTLDQLGVRAVWLTPFQTNPDDAYLASDGLHSVTGYHGYWPTRAREVDPRLGGEEALRAVVAAAHGHGIRILQDFVINHVHENHEYVAANPDWFRTGCVCGTNGCDWTADALICTFTDYLPDIDHSVPEANAQFVADAVWWLDEFNLDGLRVDAVKHVEEVATRNMAAEVRETFELAGTRYFLMGETAMGWSDCPDPCNDENYGTIARYVGPFGLDGQFDFVLYHGVSYRTFAYSDAGMIHADFWFAHGQSKWPEGAVMTPYIGSHDTPRFTTLADYRGQDAGHDRGVAHSQWDNTAIAPGDDEPYRRTRIALAWLLGLPGAPLLYYGDEYGQWGGADPNNRLMWRDEAQLGAWEAETLAFVRQLGQARRASRALRRGDYVSLQATEDTLVYGRLIEPGDAAIVALTRAQTAQQATVSVIQLGLDPGVALSDEMGGPGTSVQAGGTVTVQIPASGAAILTP